jgi:hypothetical protein
MRSPIVHDRDLPLATAGHRKNLARAPRIRIPIYTASISLASSPKAFTKSTGLIESLTGDNWRTRVCADFNPNESAVRDCQQISVSTSGQETVVPVAMKQVSSESQFGHLLIGNFDPRRVGIGIEITFHG